MQKYIRITGTKKAAVAHSMITFISYGFTAGASLGRTHVVIKPSSKLNKFLTSNLIFMRPFESEKINNLT